MKGVRPEFKLPDGTTTKDPECYVEAWNEFARPLLAALGDASLAAYDPGLLVVFRGRWISFDTDVIEVMFHRKGN